MAIVVVVLKDGEVVRVEERKSIKLGSAGPNLYSKASTVIKSGMGKATPLPGTYILTKAYYAGRIKSSKLLTDAQKEEALKTLKIVGPADFLITESETSSGTRIVDEGSPLPDRKVITRFVDP